MAFKLLSRFADETGDGTGNINATGNYAGDPTQFRLVAAPGEYFDIHRCIISVQSAAITNADVYADAGLLSVGISMYVSDHLGEIQYTLIDPQHPVTTIGHWAHYCYDLNIWAGLAGGNDHAACRWSFNKFGPHGIELLPGWSFNILVEDDLTDLVEHHILAQGHWHTPEIGNDAGHA